MDILAQSPIEHAKIEKATYSAIVFTTFAPQTHSLQEKPCIADASRCCCCRCCCLLYQPGRSLRIQASNKTSFSEAKQAFPNRSSTYHSDFNLYSECRMQNNHMGTSSSSSNSKTATVLSAVIKLTFNHHDDSIGRSTRYRTAPKMVFLRNDKQNQRASRRSKTDYLCLPHALSSPPFNNVNTRYVLSNLTEEDCLLYLPYLTTIYNQSD